MMTDAHRALIASMSDALEAAGRNPQAAAATPLLGDVWAQTPATDRVTVLTALADAAGKEGLALPDGAQAQMETGMRLILATRTGPVTLW